MSSKSFRKTKNSNNNKNFKGNKFDLVNLYEHKEVLTFL